MSPPPLRLMMLEGKRYPQLCVRDAEGQWQPIGAIERLELVADAKDGAGMPRLKVMFCPVALAMVDVTLDRERCSFGLAGADPALVDAAREVVRREAAAAVPAKPSRVDFVVLESAGFRPVQVDEMTPAQLREAIGVLGEELGRAIGSMAVRHERGA